MAKRCDLMVHHGGHSSVMTGLMAGTLAVISSTITERVSNARRLAALGADEVVIPTAGADGEKHIDVAEFGQRVPRVLAEPSYRQSALRVAKYMRQFGGAQAVSKTGVGYQLRRVCHQKIRFARRGAISRSGRALHWQRGAMPHLVLRTGRCSIPLLRRAH